MHPYKSTTHDERFFHINLDPMGTEVSITPPGTKHKCSHKTVFARREEITDVENEVHRTWRVSVAYCDARDQFSRELGRKVARRKYFQGKAAWVKVLDEKEGFTFAEAVKFNLNHV